MKLWQKLTIDWPCALGDWLSANLVVAPAAFLDRLTVRVVARIVLQIIFFVVLLVYFQQIMSLDLGSLFFIDVATYPDMIAGLFALVAAGFAGRTLGAAARAVKPHLQNCAKVFLRFASRQRRNANAIRRKGGAGRPKQSEDEPAAWGAYYAVA